MKKIINHPIFLVILVYSISNMLLIVNNGIYWDDWTIYNMDYNSLRLQFDANGGRFMTPIHYFLINLTPYPAIIYYVFTFFLEILGIVLFSRILTLLKICTINNIWSTLLFATIPYYHAKIYLICLPYTIGFFIFLSAIFIFLLYDYKRRLALRIISLVLLFLSYLFLSSTLLLSLSFFLLLAIYRNRQFRFSWILIKQIFKKIFEWTDFIVLPFIFWGFKQLALKPSGLYAADNYNEISITTIINTPFNLILTFKTSLIHLGYEILNVFNSTNTMIYLFIVLLVLFMRLLKKHKLSYVSKKYNLTMIYFGVYFFIAGALAYILVGKIPSFDGYDTRHQILLRIGAPFILLGLVNLLFSIRFKKIIMIALVTSFVACNVIWQLQHQKSWFKQEALELLIKENPGLEQKMNILVIDNADEYNETEENIRFYCYSALFKKAFNNESHFVIQEEELASLKGINLNDLANATFSMKDCSDMTNFRYKLIINKGKDVLNLKTSLEMLFLYYYNRNKFNAFAKQIIEIDILPNNNLSLQN